MKETGYSVYNYIHVGFQLTFFRKLDIVVCRERGLAKVLAIQGDEEQCHCCYLKYLEKDCGIPTQCFYWPENKKRGEVTLA